MTSSRINQAARQAGISTHYVDAQGQQQEISDATLYRLLQVMGTPSEEQSHDSTVTNALTPFPQVLVFRQSDPYLLPLSSPAIHRWTLQLEDGSHQQGSVHTPHACVLPGPLPTGYHQLNLEGGNVIWSCRLIIAPARCFEPAELLAGQKLWGVCIQLYTLRSAHNWGIGDFGDLEQLLPWLAEHGGAFVGLNPLHALYPAVPDWASPYSPSSRQWLNILYINVNAVAEFQSSPQAQQWWQNPETQSMLSQARGSAWVDYPAVTHLKLTALRLAYHYFTTLPADHPRQRMWNVFLQQEGDRLWQQAAFDVLHTSLSQGDQQGWLNWPLRWHSDPRQCLAELQQDPLQAQELYFYAWLQWLAHQQLSHCYAVSQQQHMPIGLYRDLAVGVTRGSATTWGDRELYCLQASIGAPPDPLGPQGQNWNLPPMVPHVLTARGYQPFIDLLRANMQSCGALRIDHVMSLQRLWWIPEQQSAVHGAYVTYPVDDLLAILALESQRHRCMIVGEDLGTVPPDMFTKLNQNGIYSYKVLYFEHDDQQRFRTPQDYPSQAIATLTTHDLPPLRSFWQGDDLQLGEELGLYPDPTELYLLSQAREHSKQGLLDALKNQGYLPPSTSHYAAEQAMTQALNQATQLYLADSQAALLGLQMEEWLDMATPVNIPGTNQEYPNWRRKLSTSLEDIMQQRDLEQFLDLLHQRRQRGEGR